MYRQLRKSLARGAVQGGDPLALRADAKGSSSVTSVVAKRSSPQAVETAIGSTASITSRLTSSVVACDIAHVPLEGRLLDVAIFCLSLMGANFTDYVREAQRCLGSTGGYTSGSPPATSRTWRVLREARSARVRRHGARDGGGVREDCGDTEYEETRPDARLAVSRSGEVALGNGLRESLTVRAELAAASCLVALDRPRVPPRRGGSRSSRPPSRGSPR